MDSEITLRMENWRDGDWDETQNGAHVMRRKGCAMQNKGTILKLFLRCCNVLAFAFLRYLLDRMAKTYYFKYMFGMPFYG